MYMKTHKSVDDAEEAVHEFLLHFSEIFASENYDLNKLNVAYIKTSFNNYVCDSFRKKKPFNFSELAQQTNEDSDNQTESKFDVPGTDDADKLLQSEEAKSIISSCYDRMKKGDVSYLRYRFEQKIPNREIAKIMGQTANYVANRVTRAKMAFIKVLSGMGLQRGDV